MSEFDAEIRNSLADIASKVSALGHVSQQAGNGVAGLGRAMKTHFNDAEVAAKKASHETYELAHALSGIGGVFGEIAHKSGGAFRMGGVLRGVALGAAGVGVAFAVMQNAIAKSNEDITESIQLQQKLSDTLRTAGLQKQANLASSADGIAGGTKTLFARAGYDGLDLAASLAGGTSGAQYDDAVRAVSRASLIRRDAVRRPALSAARDAARLGEGSMDEGISAVTNSPLLQWQIGSGALQGDDLTAQLILLHQRKENPTLKLTKANRDRIRANEFSNGHTDFMDNLNEYQGLKNVAPLVAAHGLEVGTATIAKAKQVEIQQNPEKVALEEFSRDFSKKMEIQNEISRSLAGRIEVYLGKMTDAIVGLATVGVAGMNSGAHKYIPGIGPSPDEKAAKMRADYIHAMQENGTAAGDGQ